MGNKNDAFWLSCGFTVELMVAAILSGLFLKCYGKRTILITGSIIVCFSELMIAVNIYNFVELNKIYLIKNFY